MKRFLAALPVACIIASVPLSSIAADGVASTSDVTVAKAGAAPLLLWRTNKDVKRLRAAKIADEKLLPTLLGDAVMVMSERAKSLKDAKTVTIRLLYSSNGGIDPRYGLPVMAGIKRVAKITAPIGALSDAKAKSLADAVRSGAQPAPLAIEIQEKKFSPPPEQ